MVCINIADSSTKNCLKKGRESIERIQLTSKAKEKIYRGIFDISLFSSVFGMTISRSILNVESFAIAASG